MHDEDEDDLMIYDDEQQSRFSRFLPAVVVLGAMVGFMTLAWYAYNSSSHPASEEDLIVVEADSAPMKEKPEDPGGMQFPNQDKTIFETFSGNPQPPAKVERVLPAPEEPLPAANEETTTWINEKLTQATPENNEPEQVIGNSEAPRAFRQLMVDKPLPDKDAPKTYVAPQDSAAPAQNVAEAPVVDVKEVPVTEVKKDGAMEVVEKAVSDLPAQPVKLIEEPAKESSAKLESVAPRAVTEAAPAAAPAPKALPTGKVQIQLGAYRSEKEARSAWVSISKKIADLSGMQPAVVKADLGAKGIYYRLRTGGFADVATAKAFCGDITRQGQACLPAAN